MKIKWLGHASFVITSDGGTKVITDPYTVGGGISYSEIQESADIVTVSHNHSDHNNVTAARGNPQIVSTPGTKKVNGIEFRGIASYHDESRGKERGPNIIFCFTIDDVIICHLGDLGHHLDDKQIAEIRTVDVVLIPIGGFYTIDASGAARICDVLKPKVIIPMHYRNSKCSYPIAGVEDFIRGKAGVKKPNSSEVVLAKDNLPSAAEVIILRHAC